MKLYIQGSVKLISGADIRRHNDNGLTPLDLIHDFDEWVNCQLFSDDVVARFKGKRRACRAVSLVYL